MKKYYYIILFLTFVWIFGRMATETITPGHVINLSFSKFNELSSSQNIEVFRAKIDTLQYQNRYFYRITFEGGHGGASFFLGCKYSEFDPRTINRLKVIKNDVVVKEYRLDQLKTLPSVRIDTFDVHVLYPY